MCYFGKLFLSVVLLSCINAHKKKGWVEPDPWSRAASFINDDIITNDVCQTENCGKNPSIDPKDKLSSVYYRKLINYLFHRDKMKADEISNYYTRTITFQLTATQLEKLENSLDPRDWDAVLSEALPKSYSPRWTKLYDNGFWSNVFGYINFRWLDFLANSEVRFTLIVIAVVLVAIFLSNKYNYGLLASIGVIVISFFIIGFGHKYYECNRDLQIQELIHVLDDDDPCESFKKAQTTSWFWGFFSKTATKEECIEHLKKKHKITFQYCMPDTVFRMYVNDVMFDQYDLIVEKLTMIFKGTLGKLSFPYNIIAAVMFALLLPMFLKLVFQYIVSPFITTTLSNSRAQGSASHTHENATEDRLSGRNLEMLLEGVRHSSVIHAHVVQQYSNNLPSGVQLVQNPAELINNLMINGKTSEAIRNACADTALDLTNKNQSSDKEFAEGKDTLPALKGELKSDETSDALNNSNSSDVTIEDCEGDQYENINVTKTN